MKWSNVKLVFFREVRDQLRDRRTLFTIAVLPLLLYPLLGMSFLQVTQFLKEHPTKVQIIGSSDLFQIEPSLIDGKQFSEIACPQKKVRRLLEVESLLPDETTVGDLHDTAHRKIRAGEYHVLVYFPRNFSNELAKFREALLKRAESGDEGTQDSYRIPQPKIYYDKADDKSRISYSRVADVLRHWREAIVQQSFQDSNIPVAATKPFELANNDVADETRTKAAMWSKILPFVVLIWALTGAFYPAIDLCAGEKERGTLETLLCSPALRGEIVWGKLFTVMSFSMATALLNMMSMGLTGLFIIRAFNAPANSPMPLPFGVPPFASMGWLVLAMVPISALFSALSLAIAAFARSSKEGQYYLMPLLLITLPLMMIPMFPGTELDLGTSLIPVTGMMLLLQSLIEARYMQALLYVVPVVGVTAVCCLLAIRWAIDQFNNESVLFSDSERWGLGLWLRHVMRDRGNTPTAGEAIFCGILLLVIQFFARFAVKQFETWQDFATIHLITQIALIATPALLMAIMLTRSPRKTLLLRKPPWLAIPAALLLAIFLHPAAAELVSAIGQLYPLGEETIRASKQLATIINETPLWLMIVLMALTPAVCEELAFRGFILSGLRHIGHKWAAIIVTSVFFGAMHGMIQQSIAACLVGIVIGYLAVQTGSLLPGLLYHFAHNSIVVLMSRVDQQAVTSSPAYRWMFRPVEDSYSYSWPLIGIGLVLSVGLLLWFRKLPFHAYDEEILQEALDHQTAHATEE